MVKYAVYLNNGNVVLSKPCETWCGLDLNKLQINHESWIQISNLTLKKEFIEHIELLEEDEEANDE